MIALNKLGSCSEYRDLESTKAPWKSLFICSGMVKWPIKKVIKVLKEDKGSQYAQHFLKL